jgi:hypothetical protein
VILRGGVVTPRWVALVYERLAVLNRFAPMENYSGTSPVSSETLPLYTLLSRTSSPR